MSVVAKFHGACASCEEPIIPGQRIEHADDEWAHVTCGELPETVTCVCSRCWTVHAPKQEACW